MARKRTGYSVVELVIIMVIFSAAAFIAVPRLQFAALYRKQADTVTRKIIGDLRRARRLAVSSAATNDKGFELKMINPEPYRRYEIVNRKGMSTVDSQTIDSKITVRCPEGQIFKFGPLGNLLSGSGTEIAVSAEGKTFTITIIPATGTVKCVER